jgi:TolA-binding protein
MMAMGSPRNNSRPRPVLRLLLCAALAAAFGAGCSIESAKKHYVLAEKLWYDGKYSAAVAEFDKVTAKDPHGKLGLQALFRAAVTQTLFLSEYEAAIRKFQTVSDLSQDPANAWEAQTQIGDLLFSKLDQYDRAIQHYQMLLQRRPDAPEAAEFLFRIGKSQFYLWQFQEAVATYREVLKRFKGSLQAERAAYELGVTFFTRGEQRPDGRGPGIESYQEAIDAFEKFVRMFPSSKLVPEARFGMASCLEELDQLDAAYHAYEALRGIYPAPKVIEIKLARIRERKAQRSR